MTTSSTIPHALYECAAQTLSEITQSKGYTRDPSLVGWCAKASLLLFKTLQRCGFTPKLKVWQSGELGHCYVECDNYIIDVTASQFGGQEVEIVPLGHGAKRQYWKARKTFLDPTMFIAYLHTHRWHADSIPHQ